jgi:hypothetical protein
MFTATPNIIAILNSYANGKLLVSRKGKFGRKSAIRDLVSISEEARELVESHGSENLSDRTGDELNNPTGRI